MAGVEQIRTLLAAIEGVSVGEGEAPLTVTVPPGRWRETATALKAAGFGFFSFLTAIDWKDDGLEVVAWVDHTDARLTVLMKTRLGAGVTSCASLVPVYRGANWMERECYDMFGIAFEEHPDLRRILLPDDWTGFPLLKSYDVDTPYPPYR
jgi:NADH-quinone oxidoreductase subunit C